MPDALLSAVRQDPTRGTLDSFYGGGGCWAHAFEAAMREGGVCEVPGVVEGSVARSYPIHRPVEIPGRCRTLFASFDRTRPHVVGRFGSPGDNRGMVITPKTREDAVILIGFLRFVFRGEGATPEVPDDGLQLRSHTGRVWLEDVEFHHLRHMAVRWYGEPHSHGPATVDGIALHHLSTPELGDVQGGGAVMGLPSHSRLHNLTAYALGDETDTHGRHLSARGNAGYHVFYHTPGTVGLDLAHWDCTGAHARMRVAGLGAGRGWRVRDIRAERVDGWMMHGLEDSDVEGVTLVGCGRVEMGGPGYRARDVLVYYPDDHDLPHLVTNHDGSRRRLRRARRRVRYATTSVIRDGGTFERVRWAFASGAARDAAVAQMRASGQEPMLQVGMRGDVAAHAFGGCEIEGRRAINVQGEGDFAWERGRIGAPYADGRAVRFYAPGRRSLRGSAVSSRGVAIMAPPRMPVESSGSAVTGSVLGAALKP